MADFKDKDVVKGIMPDRYSKDVDDLVMSMIATMGDDVGLDSDTMEDMFIQGIPSLNRVGTTQTNPKKYIDALKFIASKIKTESNIQAYRVAFPDKCIRLDSLDRTGDINGLASMYNRSTLVVALEADMMVGLHIQYAGFRHKAIQHQYHLMNGTASPSKVPMFKKDKKGIIIKDEYGRGIKHTYPNGEIVYDMVYPNVSPTVQQLASSKILELTAIPIDLTIKVEHGLDSELIQATRETNRKLHNLALAQREKLLKGGDILDVQVIGQAIDVNSSEEDDILDIKI